MLPREVASGRYTFAVRIEFVFLFGISSDGMLEGVLLKVQGALAYDLVPGMLSSFQIVDCQ
jgi:hypothetical protein